MLRTILSQKSRLNIGVITGGTGQILIEYSSILRTDLLIVCDVPKDIELIRLIDEHPHILYFALGVGETTDTLAAKGHSELAAIAKACGNATADAGLGQARRLGGIACEDALRSGSLHEFVRHQLMPLLFELGKGAIDEVLVHVFDGLSGGTGSMGGMHIGKEIVRSILEQTSAIVTLLHRAVGGLSYFTIGARTAKNAACGVVDALAFTLAPDRDPRESRRLQLIEVPSTGRDRFGRNQFVLAAEQAAHASEVKMLLDRLPPNDSLNARCGNVSIWRCGYFRPLDASTEVAPFVAGPYADILRQVLIDSGPREGYIDQLLFSGVRTAIAVNSLKHILNNLHSTDVEKLIDAICAPSFRLLITVSMMLHDGRKLGLTNASTTWAMPPRNVGDLERRFVEQSSCIQKLEEDFSILDAARENLSDQLQEQQDEFREIHRRLLRRSLWDKTAGAMSSTEAKVYRLSTLAAEMRATSDLLVENDAESRGIAFAREQVQKENQHLKNKIGRMADRLSGLVPRMSLDNERLVDAQPIDQLFSALWSFSNEGNEDELLRLICSSVRKVTMAGLARMVRANDARPDSIAARISSHQFEVLGPPWGGSFLSPQLVIHVLPPMEEELQDKLRKLITSDDRESMVCYADSVSGVANCCTLFISTVSDIDQVMTSFYRKHLIEAHRDPRKALFVSNDSTSAADLGIEIS